MTGEVVTGPEPEDPAGSPFAGVSPVLPRSVADLGPLLDWLRGGAVADRRIDFPAGTAMPDGRLDLCKQALGPEGAALIAEASVRAIPSTSRSRWPGGGSSTGSGGTGGGGGIHSWPARTSQLPSAFRQRDTYDTMGGASAGRPKPFQSDRRCPVAPFRPIVLRTYFPRCVDTSRPRRVRPRHTPNCFRHATGVSMRYELLGPLLVSDDSGAHHTLSAPKMEMTLATLLMSAGRVTTKEQLVAELWSSAPPRRASAAVHVYLSQLRKFLAAAGDHEGRAIVTKPSGYVLHLDGAGFDVDDFQELMRAGRAHQHAGRYEEALEAFEGPRSTRRIRCRTSSTRRACSTTVCSPR